MKWTIYDEIVQNILALSIIAIYLIMAISLKETPAELKIFTGAILVAYGFKVWKNKKNGE
jgi:heterodisulfide reductase subunit A-like polyferredoxin